MMAVAALRLHDSIGDTFSWTKRQRIGIVRILLVRLASRTASTPKNIMNWALAFHVRRMAPQYQDNGRRQTFSAQH
jgi:hypothetical protein